MFKRIFKEKYMSIFEKISSRLPSIIFDFETESKELNHVLPKLREKLLEEGHIVKYDEINSFNGSLVAVDGSKVTTPLSGTDLLLAAATVGEGHSTVQAYTEDDSPEEAWVKGVVHKGNNDFICSDVMAALELIVLHRTQADLKIIDGTYLGNISNILYPLVEKIDVERIDTVLTAILSLHSENDLLEAMQEILYPPRDNSGKLIALPKNDTAKVFSKEFLKNEPHLVDIMPDRLLASRLLYPGEMIVPRVIHSNPALINHLQKMVGKKYDGKHEDLYNRILKDKLGLLRRMDKGYTEENILYASYFKPYVALKESKAMKIEFPYYSDAETGEQGLLNFAKEKISIVNNDVIDGYILEPWCQYMADVKAKEISAATDLVKNAIAAESTDSYEIVAFTRGYRT